MRANTACYAGNIFEDKYKENTQDDQDGSSRQKILMGYFYQVR